MAYCKVAFWFVLSVFIGLLFAPFAKADGTADKLIDAATNGIAAISSKLEALTVQYGPDVWQATQGVIKVDAIGNIITIVLFIIIGFIAYKCIRPSIAFAKKFAIQCRKNRGYENPETAAMDDTPAVLLVVLSIIITGVCTIIVLVVTFNIWNWIGLFYPKLYLAHKILSL